MDRATAKASVRGGSRGRVRSRIVPKGQRRHRQGEKWGYGFRHGDGQGKGIKIRNTTGTGIRIKVRTGKRPTGAVVLVET